MAKINGHDSFKNTLIMKSRLKNYLQDYDWLDLPSFTTLDCNGKETGIFENIGHIVLESNEKT